MNKLVKEVKKKRTHTQKQTNKTKSIKKLNRSNNRVGLLPKFDDPSENYWLVDDPILDAVKWPIVGVASCAWILKPARSGKTQL
jgi:hypothetical protein